VKIDLFPRRLAAILKRDLDIDAVIAQYREVVAGKLNSQPIQPGVSEVIRDAQSLGFRLAVASGSTHRWVDGHLERLGILKHFQCTVCCEDTPRHKPDPDPYLRACELLGVEPAAALALEDSALGITAAKAAGMSAVAVPTAMTGYQDFGHADLVLGALDELGLGEMMEKLES
jgi:HAD superfamily hydrolase (TIGR01509 family)